MRKPLTAEDLRTGMIVDDLGGIQGERAFILCLAVDKAQAAIAARYIAGYFEQIPALTAMVSNVGPSSIDLRNDTTRRHRVGDCRVQQRIAAGEWRESQQAKEWAGGAVAEVLDLDLADKSARAKVAALLKTWIANGVLKVVERTDAQRKLRIKVLEGGADNPGGAGKA